ncbi:putative BsuMI modification methylase subunit YdiO [Marinobacter litoralis]|uniref:DNA (cytosine-5-)-methyltransferase n=1 Tax=Marinobacter litoralis TaxID=187981 RepID=A0A3M2RJA1_9GAMM|nr:DNA cytosine methyltransferase [Marinobacter litoralis]RMJ05416.1 putative BsuMI modification methylase subunit YdiO [Marinobacter litoralis]
MSDKLRCIELFCGCGGMSLGLKNAGFSVEFAADLEASAVATYNKNFERSATQADVNKLTPQQLLSIVDVERGELDLMSGGPPCQGFSKQRRGAHLLEDKRNFLIKDYVQLIDGVMPKAFILENVAVFGQKRGQAYLEELSAALHDEYYLNPNFYNSADFGLAQTRERFILVGIRRDIAGRFDAPKPSVKTWKTVKEAIGDLPPPPSDCSEHPNYPNHMTTRISEKNRLRFSFVPQGGGWKDIPWEHRLECHKVTDPKAGGWPDVYGRLSWDKQCPTITGGFDSFTRGRYGHPEQNRALTPREAARLQGFPDWFVFAGNRHQVRHQIGNAVPPPLAQAIGESIKTALAGGGTAQESVTTTASQFSLAI